MGETMSDRQLTGDAEMEELQRKSFSYFLQGANPDNGLVIDKTQLWWPASIAATGLALAAYPAGVERRFMPRAAADGTGFATSDIGFKSAFDG